MTAPQETPRTDAQSWTEYDERGNMHETKAAVSRHHAEQLELELAEAKTELERLRANLRRAVEIAECGLVGPASDSFRSELDQLKATINQDNK